MDLMTQVLAAEGGYQNFTLGGAEWGWLIFAAAVAVIALLLGVVLMRGVLRQEQGTEKMQEIAGAIQEGALAYLRRQFRTIGIIVIPLAVVVFVTSTAIAKNPVLDGVKVIDGEQVMSFVQSGTFRTIAFIVGCLFSAAIGFLGMWLAVRGNVRTAAAARRNDYDGALQVAFRTGGVAGLLTAGLGLLGTVVIVMLFQNTSTAILVGFGFGGSLLALFLRVGGGIFTKAADVGADLVGKVEAGIPEDDPRNPATIADNVGDNVGDCAGMASDLFESFAVTLVASIILGVSAFHAIGLDGEQAAKGLIFPLAVVSIGLVASMIGIFLVRGRASDNNNALRAINRGIYAAQVLAIIGAAFVAFLYIGNPEGARLSHPGARVFGAIVAGVILGFAASRITQYFTSTEDRPVRDIAKSARTGPATTVLEGISTGLESAVWALVAIAVAIGAAIILGGGNVAFSLYLVALTGIGMLATTGIIVAEDTFGPVADNAAGIAEMSGELHGEPEKIMVGLDAVGNTTKAVTKGFAIGSAVIAAVALFASYSETIAKETVDAVTWLTAEAEGTLASLVKFNVADPKTFIGLLIGGSVAFLFSSLAIRAVSRTAGTVVEEVRRQFREKPGIMTGEDRPDYGPVIDICTRASLRELATPALLAVLTPIIIGFGIGYLALGAFLAAAIVSGQLMANFLSNAGGAWDNAKKYIEDGHEGGKGSETHKAAVIGDTVGDPFKDTAGPALNPLIKVMNLVSLLVLPAIIELDGNNVRFVIAGGALVVVLGAIWFSKKQDSGISAPAEVAS